jgi:hypothetical protein
VQEATSTRRAALAVKYLLTDGNNVAIQLRLNYSRKGFARDETSGCDECSALVEE